MSGSVFFVGLVIVVGAVLAVTLSTLFLVPAIVIALGFLAVPPLLALLKGSAIASSGHAPHGVPETREASYDPVQDPSRR